MRWNIEVSGVVTMDGRKVMPEEAYQLHAPEIAAAKPRPYKLGLQHVQDRVGNALPHLRALRPRMISKANVIELAQIDALPTLLGAFVYLSLQRLGPQRAPAERRSLRAMAIDTRRFLRDAYRLAFQMGCMQHGPRPLEMGMSHESLSSDLLRLVRLFRSDLEATSSLVGISEDALAGAEVLAAKLMDTCGRATELAMLVEADQRVRQQSFGLLNCAYGCARFGVGLVVSSDEEVDRITPLLAAIPVPRGAGRRARARADSHSTLDAYVSAESAEQIAPSKEK